LKYPPPLPPRRLPLRQLRLRRPPGVVNAATVGHGAVVDTAADTVGTAVVVAEVVVIADAATADARPNQLPNTLIKSWTSTAAPKW